MASSNNQTYDHELQAAANRLHMSAGLRGWRESWGPWDLRQMEWVLDLAVREFKCLELSCNFRSEGSQDVNSIEGVEDVGVEGRPS